MSEVKAIPILTLLVVADWLVAGFAGVAGALARRGCFTIIIINMCLLIEKRLNTYAAGGEFGHYNMQTCWKMTETLTHGYSSESTQRELSNKYQHERVSMVFKNLCVLLLWTKEASALGGLMSLYRWTGLIRTALDPKFLSGLGKNWLCILKGII